MCERGLFERMKSCKEGVNNARGKKGLRGKRCKKSILKLLIEENVKRRNDVRMREWWELLEEGQLCKEGKKTF